jgi:hypothetical protein
VNKSFEELLEGIGYPGLPELCALLVRLLGEKTESRLVSQDRVKAGIYRLKFDANGKLRAFIVKRLKPGIAQRNQFVAERWLPAVGLGQSGPPLLGVAADLDGRCVWHVYEDLGGATLDVFGPDPERVRAAVELVAQVHLRFAGHRLLGECRLWGGDLGIHFYLSSVRDAMRSLNALRLPAIDLSPERQDLRDCLLGRLSRLLEDEPARAQYLEELGGPETLLHGDLWTSNIITIPTPNGYQVRLIDWDHAAVGPFSYDLSTFLFRFPSSERQWILDLYREALAKQNWHLPVTSDLNRLFETHELARIANRVIWPAIAILDGMAEWGFEALAMIEQWFEQLQPAFQAETEGETRIG